MYDMIMDSPEKSYYNETDAVDMCINRIKLHCDEYDTPSARARAASMFMAPGWPHYERLLNVILYGVPAENETEKEIEQVEIPEVAEDA